MVKQHLLYSHLQISFQFCRFSHKFLIPGKKVELAGKNKNQIKKQ